VLQRYLQHELEGVKEFQEALQLVKFKSLIFSTNFIKEKYRAFKKLIKVHEILIYYIYHDYVQTKPVTGSTH
jgi:hypothetical protein